LSAERLTTIGTGLFGARLGKVELRRGFARAQQARAVKNGNGRYHPPAGRLQTIDQTGFARAAFLDLAETEQARDDVVNGRHRRVGITETIALGCCQRSLDILETLVSISRFFVAVRDMPQEIRVAQIVNGARLL
jgi:hypothetical protein